MAHVEKFNRGQIGGLTIHWERKTENHSNKDIDNERSHLNYDLCEKNGDIQERMKERLDEVYCLNRKDVNVCASWVVTLPQELINKTVEEQRMFFEKTYDFLSDRYGKANVLGGHVHNDETTPHMHFTFIPVTYDKKKEREKVSAKEVVSRTDLRTFHTDLHDFLKQEIPHIYEKGILNDKTIGIDSVQELKKHSKEIQQKKDEMTKELKVFKEPQKVLETVQANAKEKKTVFGGEKFVQLSKKNYEQLEELALSSMKLKNVVDKMRNADNEQVVALEKEVETLKHENTKNEQKNEFLRNANSNLLQENTDLKANIEKRAEELKDGRFSELEKENAKLKEDLQNEKNELEYVKENYIELHEEKQDLEEKFNLAVEDNERLHGENNKLRDRIDHLKWRFDRLWDVTKAYLQEHSNEAVKTVKLWFEIETGGEEIEPKQQKNVKKRQHNRDDLSL